MLDEIKPITDTTAAGAVPEELKKFAGTDGKLDMAKLSQGYLEAQKMAHEATGKRAEAERAYAVLAEQIGGPAAAAATESRGRGSEGDDDAEPERALTRADAQPVVQAFIELIHPEVAVDSATGVPKDKTFWDGLTAYVRTLPAGIKQSIASGDFAAQDWAIKQYKAMRGVSQNTNASSSFQTSIGQKPNFVEGPSANNGDGKKTWTHEEIQILYGQNPAEYAKRADEIAKAYDEGRVR